MADQISVSGPVTIRSDSHARVAYDLAIRISTDSKLTPEQRDEKYWLALYRKCYKVTNGMSVETSLKED